MGIKTFRAKPTKVFQNLPPDKHPDTHMCEEMLRNVKKWVRNVSFSGNFVYVLSKWSQRNWNEKYNFNKWNISSDTSEELCEISHSNTCDGIMFQ